MEHNRKKMTRKKGSREKKEREREREREGEKC